MTRKYPIIHFCGVLLITLMLLAASCSSNNDPKQDLASYCIRECVIETSASEICDTECKCATEKLSSKYSTADFVNLVQSITQDNADSIEKLKNSLKTCKETGE